MNLISSEPKIGQFARKGQRIRLLQGKFRAIMCMFLAIFRHRLFVGASSQGTPFPLSSKVFTLEKRGPCFNRGSYKHWRANFPYQRGPCFNCGSYKHWRANFPYQRGHVSTVDHTNTGELTSPTNGAMFQLWIIHTL